MKAKISIFFLVIAIFSANLAAKSELQGISREQAMKILAQRQGQSNVSFTNPQNLPSLVLYTTSWCGYCKKISPHIDKIEKEFQGKLFIKRVDVEAPANRDFVMTHKTGGNGVPHIQIYGQDGTLLRSQLGYQDHDKIKAEVGFFI